MKMTISNTPISLSTMNKMLNLLKLYIFRCTVLYIASAFKKIPKVVSAVMFVYYHTIRRFGDKTQTYSFAV